MNLRTAFFTFLGCSVAMNAYALGEGKEITIYNQGMALIKEELRSNLKIGINEVVFNEVSKDIIPQSILVYGDGIEVIEQNFGINEISYANMLKENIGKKVKTLRVNPVNGKYEFDEAKILAVDERGKAVLEFGYGIQTGFDGEVIFDKLPSGVSNSPILKTKIKSNSSEKKNVGLAYLSTGFSWNANYVAKIIDDKYLNLLGRMSINNKSGSSYKKIRVNLMAGDVNVAKEQSVQPKLMRLTNAVDFVRAAVVEEPESLNGNYLYKIPYVTDINDGEVKQVSFINGEKVEYKKDNEIISTLYLSTVRNSFKDVNPIITYSFNNVTENGLGEPLPKGKVSFYDKDKSGEMQFIGDDIIANKAKGQDVVLKIGKNFDIFASGEFSEIQKIGERKYKRNANDACVSVDDTYIFGILYKITNSSNYVQKITLKQYFPSEAEIISEDIAGVVDNDGYKVWNFEVKEGEEYNLNVKVEHKIERKDCSNKIYLD